MKRTRGTVRRGLAVPLTDSSSLSVGTNSRQRKVTTGDEASLSEAAKPNRHYQTAGQNQTNLFLS